MAYRDLRDFLRTLETGGVLKRVRAEVDPELEITEIADRTVKAGGPALWFERVKGSPYPVVLNLFGSEERMRLALETESLDAIGQRLRELVTPPSLSGLMDKLAALPRLAEVAGYFPRTVRHGPCQDVVEEPPSLASLPVLKCWPKDGGRFITLPLVITRDPRTGRRNVGMYRMQVYDDRTTGMHWHLHKDGSYHFLRAREEGGGPADRLEVAVALGADPATIYAATAPLPRDVDEFFFAGFLRRAPVELVRCKTVDLEVPAHAEFVLEGYVRLDEFRREGPFGDHTGFYSEAADYPVFHLTCLTRRRDPIYPTIVVGRPPMEDTFMGKATERIFLPLIQLQLPEIVDYNFPVEGVFHNCVVVAIKKTYPGHARKVMHALWGMGQLMFTRLIVVVDHDVNVQDLSEVAFTVLNHIDAQRDVEITRGPVDDLDHATPVRRYGGKMGIDATRKWPEEGQPRGWPEAQVMTDDVRDLVTRRWKEYGF